MPKDGNVLFHRSAVFDGEIEAEVYGIDELKSSLNIGFRPIELALLNREIMAVRRLGQAMLQDGTGDGYGSRWDALRYCISRSWRSEVQALLDFGADIEAVDDNGFGAVHWAASVSCLSMIYMVSAAGANPLLRAPNGETPASMASERYNGIMSAAVAEVLMEGLAGVRTER